MRAIDENAAKRLTKALFSRALYHLQGDYDSAIELVQEVWEKVLCFKNIKYDKINVNYLKRVLDYHYYDQQRMKINNRQYHLGDLSDAAMALWAIQDNYEMNGEQYDLDITEQILGYLQNLKDGWIYLEMLENNYNLKELAQVKCMKYNTILKKKNRLDRFLKQKIKEGGGGAILTSCMASVEKHFVIFLGFYRYRGKQLKK